MSLFDELNIDPDNFTWEDLAACKGMDINWFYDSYEGDEVHARNADKVCYNCPALAACGLHAIDHKEEGLWGGVYWSNGKPDRTKNKHKTEEDWQWLEEQYNQRLR